MYEPGEPLEHIYFPTSSMISLLYTTEDGATAEMGMVGKDGAMGVALFLGGATMPHRAVVKVGGGAYRMSAHVLREEFARAGALQNALLRYTQALITEIAQTAVCNRLHPIEKRLCRWLLLSHDRVHSNDLMMTQEAIAKMLGGRREAVTIAAGRLQNAGFIHYCRGHIRILNRQALQKTACECYEIVRRELDRLFVAQASR